MWGFGWLSKSAKKSDQTPDKLPNQDQGITKQSSELLLEDLPPKFEDNVDEKLKQKEMQKQIEKQIQKPDILQKAVSSISTDDFKNVHQIPCFRQGMLAGIGIGGVVFAVLISTRSSLNKSMNWSMGGFLIGSVASWEQCRSKMRQSKRNAQAVRESLRKPRDNTIEPPKRE